MVRESRTPTPPRPKGIAVGGFMGSGKSTVGRLLAARTGMPFVDLDDALTLRHGAIADQIRTEGEAVFRERERALVRELCDGVARVLSTGGGTWADPRNRELLAGAYRTVVLVAPLEVLRERVGAGAGRPLWPEAADRLRARQPAYGDAEIHVDVSRLGPDAVVDTIVARIEANPPARITVPLGERAYEVVLSRGAFAGLGEALQARGVGRVVVVSDSRVAPLWATELARALGRASVVSDLLCVPAGEVNKRVGVWSRCLDDLLALGVDRSTPIVALGGGVVGDLVGFASAVALRGVPLVQVPTTLLAMVDSSVGGKTAVDHPLGKNLLGAFHQPLLVWAGLHTLGTLPADELRSGLGEVVKMALIGDEALLIRLERDAEALRRGEVDALFEVIETCVRAKAAIVAADEREGGRRALLNAGHTVGHAYEAALGFSGLRHGEAVMLGILAETAWAVRAGHCLDPGLPGRLSALAARLGLPVVPPNVPADRLVRAMRLDKKARGDMLVLPVPRLAGDMDLVELPTSALGELVPEPS